MENFPEYEISPKEVLHRVTTMIGESGAGKTTIVKHFLHVISPHISQAFLISSTAKLTRDFEGIIPDACIHKKLNIDFIKTIQERQFALVEAYKKINNEDVLNSLYNKIDHSKADRVIADIENKIRADIQKLGDTPEHETENEEEIKKLNSYISELIVGIKKKEIAKNRDTLLAMRLSDAERFSVCHLDLNPNIALIFDDITEEIKQLKNNSTFRDLFFIGRHGCITSLMILHTDKALEAELKKSCAFTILVDAPTAVSFLTRDSTGLARKTRAKLSLDVEKIIGTKKDPAPKKWQRAVFSHGQLYRFTAKMFPPKMIYSEYMLGFINAVVEKSKNTITNQNKFSRMYHS